MSSKFKSTSLWIGETLNIEYTNSKQIPSDSCALWTLFSPDLPVYYLLPLFEGEVRGKRERRG